jgi:hypothetical protein
MIDDAMLAKILPLRTSSPGKVLSPPHIGFMVMKVQDAIAVQELKTCAKVADYLYRELKEAFPGIKNTLRLSEVSAWLCCNKGRFNAQFVCL